jgi:hypothetical protein
MVKNKMTWTLNAVLVAMTATVVLLPSPAEIRKALEYGQQQRQIIVDPQTEAVQIEVKAEAELAARSVAVSDPDAMRCLIDTTQTHGPEAVYRCLPSLVEDVSRYDAFARRSVVAGHDVHPHPRIEEKRMAVIQLCRAKWTGESIDDTGPDADQCAAIMQGVAY